MVYIPEIIDYKPFYIQTDVDSSAINTTEWGLIAKTNPFPVLPAPKEPYKNDWADEDGDDEYIGLTDENGDYHSGMRYEPIEFDVSFYIKTTGEEAEKTLVSQIESFFQKISRREFKIYDSYTGIGRQKVRYAGFDEESYKRNKMNGEGWARAIFSVKFKVNDPITRITLSGDRLIEA